MRRLVAEAAPGLLALFVAASVGWAEAPSSKLKELGTDTLRIDVKGKPSRSSFRVDIATDGDTAAHIILQAPKVPEVLPGPRSPKDETADVVRFGENVVIEEDEEIEGDVVAIGGNIEIRGQVNGDAVAVGGKVRIRSSGRVGGDAVAIGGKVQRDPGSRVQGGDIGMGFVPEGAGRLFGAGGWQLPVLFLWILTSLLFFLVGLLLEAVMPQRMRNMSHHVRDHLWQSLFVGIAVEVLFPATLVLLCVTVIGIPVALLAPVALMLSLLIGYLVVVTLVGMRLGGFDAPDRSTWLKAMAMGLALFLGFPLLASLVRLGGGPLAWLGAGLGIFGFAAICTAATIGLGSLVLTRLGKRVRGPAAPATPTSDSGSLPGTLSSPGSPAAQEN